jgi:NAD(P)H-dependent FMN reductase
MQVSGGSQSFNAVNTLRLLGGRMRTVTIPNQSSVAKAYDEFEDGRMKPSTYYDRIVISFVVMPAAWKTRTPARSIAVRQPL